MIAVDVLFIKLNQTCPAEITGMNGSLAYICVLLASFVKSKG